MFSSAGLLAWSIWNTLWKLEVKFAGDPSAIEQIALRWLHIVAGIIWLGFLSFFLLAVTASKAVALPAREARGRKTETL